MKRVYDSRISAEPCNNSGARYSCNKVVWQDETRHQMSIVMIQLFKIFNSNHLVQNPDVTKFRGRPAQAGRHCGCFSTRG